MFSLAHGIAQKTSAISASNGDEQTASAIIDKPETIKKKLNEEIKRSVMYFQNQLRCFNNDSLKPDAVRTHYH